MYRVLKDQIYNSKKLEQLHLCIPMNYLVGSSHSTLTLSTSRIQNEICRDKQEWKQQSACIAIFHIIFVYLSQLVAQQYSSTAYIFSHSLLSLHTGKSREHCGALFVLYVIVLWLFG
ncbi:Hypothetical_protein [Hexamita inflata]|uniref:Hypothetical_protein n=1 Tax=Hexamita inflata TaxID=28002 RepID=A0AA86RRD6_9EUKA|nr:Hypothetical protein HINF_LOCUS65858 [Hexamita inflata]